jgi:serralysin
VKLSKYLSSHTASKKQNNQHLSIKQTHHPDIPPETASKNQMSKVIDTDRLPQLAQVLEEVHTMLRNEQFVNRVLELTNQYRAKNGLAALKLNEELTVTAEFHSIDMAKQDYMEHVGLNGSLPWDRAKLVGFDSRYMAENIAGGQDTPEAVVQAWIDSPGHRANLLSANYTEMGLGYYQLNPDWGNYNYEHYWTQLFASKDLLAATYLTSPFTAAPAPVPAPAPAPAPSDPTPPPVVTVDQSLPKLVIDSSEPSPLTLVSSEKVLNPLKTDRSLDSTIDLDDDSNLSNDRSDEADILMGTRGNDKLMGNDGDNILMGLGGRDRLLGDAGEDELIGGGGRDRLVGGTGDDLLIGGGGRDLFVFESSRVFNTNDFGIDQITDFKKRDKIVLDRTSFGEITVQEITFVKDDLSAETSAGKIAYSQETGNLFFNANGSQAGFGAGGQFAKVDSDNNPLTAAPILAIGNFQFVA